MTIKHQPPNPRDFPYQVGTINGSPHAIQYVNSGGVVSDAAFCVDAERAAYFVHAANAYPDLILALRGIAKPALGGKQQQYAAQAVLAAIGEQGPQEDK